ncbi:7248_t:CDS:2 [Acaulospora colombiana]|uniref:7248_t:CDS:1 n=1 Tax=Acaulospora colombiana TaxID=27376 RepID=A0ACA9LQK5_9GLOM|nr:7248_t:CDS:2 [Acaulospora colombiana]
MGTRNMENIPEAVNKSEFIPYTKSYDREDPQVESFTKSKSTGLTIQFKRRLSLSAESQEKVKILKLDESTESMEIDNTDIGDTI